MSIRKLSGLAIIVIAAGCAEEPQPRSVSDFLDDEIGLEATLSRCNAQRSLTRNDPECKNAREANKRLATEREAELQRRFEAESQRKREAIRDRNEAIAAARRRAEEAERVRQEELYELQFQGGAGNPAPTDGAESLSPAAGSNGAGSTPDATAGSDVSEAPAADEPPPDAGSSSDPETADLGSLREELERRNRESKNDGR